MGGAGSTNERAEEEEREAASALRREIMKLKLKEEHLALEQADEEEREAASAKRREIMEKELKEKRLALERAEEEREAASAKRPEIKELLEEHKALMWQIVSVGVRTSIILCGLLFSVGVRTSHILRSFLTILFTMSGVEEKLQSLKRQSEALKRPETMMSMQRDRPMGIPRPVKLPDPPSMQIVSPLKPRPHLLPRQIVSPYETRPNISREHLLNYDIFSSPRRPKSNLEKMRAASPASSCESMSSDCRPIPEKIRAGSPASSCGSMKSNRSMTLPVSVKRPASCESVKSDQSMGPPIAFKRRENVCSFEPRPHLLPRQIVSPYEPRPNISREHLLNFEPGPHLPPRPKSNPEKMRAASPASSCESTMSDGSMDLPATFKREDFWSPERGHYIILSSLTIPFTMSGFEEDERAEEGTENSLLRRWIMELQQKAGSPVPSCPSMKSDRSRTPPLNFRNEPGTSDTKDRGIDAGLWTQLNSMVSHLQEHISDCQNEMNMLKKFVRAVNPEGQGECEEGLNVKEEAQRRGSREGFLKITLDFLRRMNQEELADSLGQSSCCSGPP